MPASSIGATPHCGDRLFRLNSHPSRFQPQAVDGCSSFNRAYGQARNNVPLEEGVGAGNGDYDEHHEGHLQGLGGELGRSLGGVSTQHGGVLCQEVRVALHPHQQVLQGHDVHVLVQVQQGQEPFIPVGQGDQQGDGGDAGLHDRKHDADQGGVFSAAVDGGGFDQLVGHGGLQESPHDNDVERTEEHGHDQCRVVIAQAQDALTDYEGGNQAAAEDHREETEEVEEIPEAEIPAEEGVSVEHGERDAQQRADDGDQEGVEVASPQRVAELEGKKNVNTAWGLIQWHPTSSLTAWANANHCVWYDGDKQALLIYRELFPVPTDPYDTSGRWTYDSTHGYTYTPDEFKVLGDYDIATGSYFYQRERAGDDTLPKRMEYAADWYEVFTGEEPPHPPHPPHPPIGDGSRPFWVYMSKSYKRRKGILL